MSRTTIEPYRGVVSTCLLLELETKLYLDGRNGRSIEIQVIVILITLAVIIGFADIYVVYQGIANGCVQGQLVCKAETAAQHGVEIKALNVSTEYITKLGANTGRDGAIDKVGTYVEINGDGNHIVLAIIRHADTSAHKKLWKNLAAKANV